MPSHLQERIDAAIALGVMMDEPQEYPREAINPRAKYCGTKWSHMWCAVGDEEKLHAVAKSLGLKRSYFQDRMDFPHYDLTEGKYWQAYALGVPVCSLREWVRARFNKHAIRAVEIYVDWWLKVYPIQEDLLLDLKPRIPE